MGTEIRLLGPPCARRDGADVGLRGHKPWLLLALLLLHGAPLSRDRLARLLFVDAADAAGTLRWNLSQLRRLGVALDADPVQLRIPKEVSIDVEQLLDGDADGAARLPGLDDELLAGLRPERGSELAVWLDEERRRIHQLGMDVRQEAALTLLGRGDGKTAVAYARQVVEAAPLDENAAAPLVRCLRMAGRLTEAKAVAADAAVRIREELGVEPTGALWSAVASPPGGDRRVTGRGAVMVQLEAGESALNAGATDAGLAALHSAVVAARAVHDDGLLARALVALGSAMIHGIRGVDQEGLALLHEAVPLTAATDDGELAASARREIGYVDFLRGRYDRAGHWFEQARRVVGVSNAELGWIDLYDGSSRDDVGDVVAALELLERTVQTAQAEHDLRLEGFGLTMLGRHHLLQERIETAITTLASALEIVQALDWTAFRSFTEGLLADALRRRGELGRARELSEHAFVLAEQVGDPCWESIALRSLGLVTIDSGDIQGGVALLADAPGQCRRLPDTYRWIELWGYDALVDIADRYGLDDAQTWATRLESEASTLGMRPFAQRARRLSASAKSRQ